jgi:hypothetical protein
MSEIADIKKEIARLLEADTEISDTLLVHVYPSRQLPGTFNNELCVFSAGSAPQKGAALGGPGKDPAYQYVIQWQLKFDSREQLATVEDNSDALENAIYRVLLHENYKNALWRRVTFPGLSLRPLAPGSTQNVEPGRTVVRMSA